MKAILGLLIVMLALAPALAAAAEVASPLTAEAGYQANFMTEFDITFWQTLPFAAFWSYLAAAQFSPASGWQIALPAAVAVSAVNAGLHARKMAASDPK
ncbi:MAG: hypothetical protein JW873_02865 [Candidatus Saganbacteria bacterium]|nr:hypothetical protein [Candidatus Saganbacteria bacterium]